MLRYPIPAHTRPNPNYLNLAPAGPDRAPAGDRAPRGATVLGAQTHPGRRAFRLPDHYQKDCPTAPPQAAEDASVAQLSVAELAAFRRMMAEGRGPCRTSAAAVGAVKVASFADLVSDDDEEDDVAGILSLQHASSQWQRSCSHCWLTEPVPEPYPNPYPNPSPNPKLNEPDAGGCDSCRSST